jgi:RHS repeat-associated protein
VPGTPGQPYYYGIDQIGSVRRAFASPTSAPAYSYDPYGVPLQATAPVTDFVYGGMFYNADSGLYLTRYRAYDPVAGRWLPRDLLGETSDRTANLYIYVGGSPTNATDISGLLAADLPQPLRNNTPENYAPSCRTCNLQKGPRTPQEWYNKGGSGGGV